MFHQNTNQSFFPGRQGDRFAPALHTLSLIFPFHHTHPPCFLLLRPPSSGHKKRNESSFLRPIPQNGSRQKREPRLADSLYMSSSYSFLHKHLQIVPITGSAVTGSLLPILMSRAVLMEEVPGIQVTDDDKFRSALPETVTP